MDRGIWPVERILGSWIFLGIGVYLDLDLIVPDKFITDCYRLIRGIAGGIEDEVCEYVISSSKLEVDEAGFERDGLIIEKFDGIALRAIGISLVECCVPTSLQYSGLSGSRVADRTSIDAVESITASVTIIAILRGIISPLPRIL